MAVWLESLDSRGQKLSEPLHTGLFNFTRLVTTASPAGKKAHPSGGVSFSPASECSVPSVGPGKTLKC